MKLESLQSGDKVHMVGIGGVSMAPLAKVLHSRGIVVTGSDGQKSAATAELEQLGIPVALGHDGKNLGAVDCVLRTAAVHEDNPEISKARGENIPVFERAQGWGAIMKGYENALCISGTHGKTTTTAMCGEIFLQAQRDPTLMLGGVLPRLGAGYCMGQGDTIILESCEYCNSFHHFFPTVAVILNIEEDHLDYFKNLAEIQESFRHFAQLVPEKGLVLVCGEDKNTVDAMKDIPHTTYGVVSGDIHSENLTWTGGFPAFDLIYHGENKGRIALQVPGGHNVSNAIAAAGSALFLGVAMEDIVRGLAGFTGAGRRFQHKGSYHGAVVMDDYAHHPTELKALLSAVEKLDYQRIICAFQPHTFTRTKAFLAEFAQVLSLADQCLLMDIYAAREPDTGEVSSAMLAQEIPHCMHTGSHENTVETLAKMAQEGDLILTVGAGDVYLVGEALVSLAK